MLTVSQIRQSVATLPQQMAATSPLLFRELTEMSARRRTYILRVLYAIALYGFTAFVFWTEMATWGGQSFSMLGRGRDLFEQIAWMQFIGIYLFLPAITSGVLTIEKERDTLSLLLLTRLGPWSILIGKLFSRLVPMASFLLLSLPLVAISYSLGGINEVQILTLAWTLAVTAVQVGALALACSAWFRTTAGAMVSAYVIGALLFLGPAILIQQGYFRGPAEFLAEYCRVQGLAGPNGFDTDEAGLLLFGPWVCLHPSAIPTLSFQTIVMRTVPIMIFTVACLFFSRLVLWNRAFVQPSNRLLKLFRSLDKLFHALNQNRLTRGIVLTREHVEMPHYHPIRWRETTKRSMGTTRYLVRLLLLLEIPVLFGMLLPYHRLDGWAPAFVSAWVVWVVAALVISVQASGLIGSERSRQTLDVLLTTPLASETIVREKFAGVWRVICVIWVPLLTIYFFQLWWMTWVGQPRLDQFLFGILRAFLALLIYPPLIAWVGFHYSLRCRSHPQAVLATLGTITGICVVPALIAYYLGTPYDGLLYELRWLSPAVTLSEELPSSTYWWSPNSISVETATLLTWLGLIAHFILAALLLWWLWWRGLTTFARRVNRNDGQLIDDDDIERLVKLREHIVGKGIFQSGPDEG